MTEAVTRHAGTETRHTKSADLTRRMRARRRLGMVIRRIEVQREWLDALEERGYLDPFKRGNRADE
jgi:hypothetical protein